jgi:hypothetical protein
MKYFKCAPSVSMVCWTSGQKKSSALLFSIFLGGLGIWTLIDAVLIACGYLTPDDGSVYIQ